MKYSKSFSSKSMIDNIKIGVTTFDEVLDTIDGSTDRRLTFDPLLPRFHKGKKYYIKKILNYYYNSMELRIPEHSGWDNREIIHLTIFFDKDEKVAFYYVKQEGGDEKYNNIPQDLPKEKKDSPWPYEGCDEKFYEEISNPNLLREKDYKNIYLEGCDWENEYPSPINQKRKNQKK